MHTCNDNKLDIQNAGMQMQKGRSGTFFSSGFSLFSGVSSGASPFLTKFAPP